MEQKNLEDHFDFLTPDDIRIKGHRIGIEHVLYPYVYESCTADQILERFDTLTLEEVRVTIEYYHQHEETIGRYLADGLEWSRERRAEQAADPSLDEWRARMAKARDGLRLLHR